MHALWDALSGNSESQNRSLEWYIVSSLKYNVDELKFIIENQKKFAYSIYTFPKNPFLQLKPFKSVQVLKVVASLVFRCFQFFYTFNYVVIDSGTTRKRDGSLILVSEHKIVVVKCMFCIICMFCFVDLLIALENKINFLIFFISSVASALSAKTSKITEEFSKTRLFF